jgi:3-dehydroquinate synthase
MITVNVDLADRSYPILIGNGLMGRPGMLDPYLRGQDVMVITNDVVAPIYLEPLKNILGERHIEVVELPDGEAQKTLETLNIALDRLVASRFGRDCTVITLGGGVVGDMGGFTAAIYQRGVDFIQVPTTLLAQVDSAVGGKTGVNHSGGKNLIGAFHQPRCVLTDTDTLRTLPDRELSAGLAEVIKYGLIVDPELFVWLEHRADDLLRRDPATLHHAIRRSCEIKAEIVVQDERERGHRALLNFGHTFGHAIEHCLGYGEWLHGEAVAAGMCMAADFSERLGWLQSGDVARIRAVFRRLKLPTEPPVVDPRDFLAAMSMDKKVLAGEIRLVLLRGIGQAEFTPDYPSHELLDMLREQFMS